MNDKDHSQDSNVEKWSENDPKMKKLQRDTMKSVLISAIACGNISVEDLKQGNWMKKLRSFVKDMEDSDFSTDHCEIILLQARDHIESNLEESILHYAMYIEHKLNYLLHVFSIRGGVSKVGESGLLRELRLSSKATWALDLLKAKPFGDDTVKKMNRIAEERNAYVHYKWGTRYENKKDAMRTLINEAESIISEISAYENEHIYGGTRAEVENMFQTEAFSDEV